MNHWLGIALIAYLIGAVIEGVNAANQMYRSASELDEETALDRESASQPSEPTEPIKENWQIFAVIASVSVCGACLWPCRLIHRSIKGEQKVAK
ncbi:hypothetical protein K9N68_22140 [Kovacikia minuta CCNUW1]|uniref:hypothetical protein n=1 Tax=Kovacikia minuta TaxID=2931930 RepID=UPI001CCBA44A|nr:hypothetical protein [Kovacikia minuta]UBF24387.1 hypothetical protein K9N68_22140 [Kovacikia minuta CCNUW1]